VSNSIIPVTLLTGFLGAGKTTLLNRILSANHGLRVAVLVNDFGAINIDTQLVVGVEGETISLANGCICCTIRDDLLKAVLGVIARPERPEYILIETSGVSDPESVAMTFMLPDLRERLYVDSILTVVDAEQAPGYSGPNAMLAQDQVAVADIVVLNKVDLCTREAREAAERWVRAISPRARILPAVQAEVPLELVLGVGLFAPENLGERDARAIHVHAPGTGPEADHAEAHAPHHLHDLIFETWSFVDDRPLDFKALRDAVLGLQTDIYRAKGVLYFQDSPQRRGLLHVVGKRVRLTVGEPWGDEAPRSQLVLIGAAGAVDPAALQARFEACLAANIPAPQPMSLGKALDWVRKTFGGAGAAESEERGA
jgi:G3E family GTPase